MGTSFLQGNLNHSSFSIVFNTAMKEFISHLHHQLQQPLPGYAAQHRMAHAVRRSNPVPPVDARIASVLALFYPKESQWHIVLIERESSNPNDRHGGQISFPGGRYEEADVDLSHTALREAEEEVGVDAQKVTVLGRLTDLYIPVSNFLVNPFVGYMEATPIFNPQLEEVRSILEVPFSLLNDPQTIRSKDMHLAENIVLRNVPFFNVFDKVVWGATAMMLSELLEVAQ